MKARSGSVQPSMNYFSAFILPGHVSPHPHWPGGTGLQLCFLFNIHTQYAGISPAPMCSRALIGCVKELCCFKAAESSFHPLCGPVILLYF